MRRTLIVCAGALLLAAPAAAHEKHSHKHAKVSKAQLEAADAASDVRGRAHLVDGRKRDKVSLHVKGLEPGLEPGTKYLWEVREGTCDDAAATASEGWTYRDLKVRPSGNANAKGRSETFSADRDDDVSVAVTLEDGTEVACGDFERKRRGHHGHGHDDHKSKGHDQDNDDHKSKGHGRGHRKP
jgi:hypothetical protein